MLFNSVEYFILLAISLCFYWSVRTLVWRQNFLLVASLVFYAYWFPLYIFLLFFLAFAAYVAAAFPVRSKKLWLVLSVVVILGTLGVFKYTDFALGLVSDIADLLGIGTKVQPIGIVLPLGISFISFQAIAYVVDVRQGIIPAERDPRVFLLFISFFPQLIAGPICRGAQLLPQLTEVRSFDARRFTGGGVLLGIGLFLKSGVADSISPFVDTVYGGVAIATGAQSLWATIGFGIQILSDFWGYSTMAVGAAMMFGIAIPINFNLPYLATSLRDFWRRWHITLSNWLRDFLYIPLGGSRWGRVCTFRNILLTMGLGGLWHGANVTFVAWGLIHGGYLVVERVAVAALDKSGIIPRWPRLALAFKPAGWALTMTVVFTAWVFFRAATVEDAGRMIAKVVSDPSLSVAGIPRSALVMMAVFAVLSVPAHHLIRIMGGFGISAPIRAVIGIYLLILALIVSSGDAIPFIYFQF